MASDGLGGVAVDVIPARNAVGLSFALNGLLFATLVSRIPAVREHLDLGNGQLGLLLLAIAAGSVLTLPTTGALIQRSSAATVVRLGAAFDACGLVLASLGAGVLELVPLAAVGLFVHGIGIGIWDVAMNVEAAEVERRLQRTVMPRFHAGWSFGSIAGAAIGIPMAAADVPLVLHLGAVALVALILAVITSRRFLPAEVDHAEPSGSAASAWTESRTLAIGAMVLAFALVEGTANDWLSLALIDGYDVRHWVGVAGFSVFVCAMTTGRLLGPVVLDRFGRVPVLRATAAAAAVGIVLVVLGPHPLVVALGILVWGLGASLGFPVGMSAAADDSRRSAARVSVVSTIGYSAFLAGPPLLGLVGDQVGTLDALLVVAVLMVPAFLSASAARPVVPENG
ncbi:MFS transporter [Nocardioides lianchengensis]|uniref:Predicted arabinose efflux permease, MFS family n=1 Tax=Nocardioides lianchengensis TaxID=1045774 RepID=A0A1G6X6N2_9ACTN|nr:MFS transporter [Nocardioides lianchengensis]NYG09077.1 fucose permease [Nocardioides lianchengensis]SDD73772.1 Predicted arabinose efflux permease, MFS family [Nocardioides lianchengensis]